MDIDRQAHARRVSPESRANPSENLDRDSPEPVIPGLEYRKSPSESSTRPTSVYDSNHSSPIIQQHWKKSEAVSDEDKDDGREYSRVGMVKVDVEDVELTLGARASEPSWYTASTLQGNG